MQTQPESEADVAGRLSQDMAAGCIGVRVGRLHRLVAREFERQLRPTGLSRQQLEVLSALILSHAPVRPTVLADLLALERSTMSRNLAVLMDRGLVAHTDLSRTGRTLAVEITPAGTAAVAQAEKAWRRAQAVLTEHLGPDAAAALDSWLVALS